MTEPAMFRPRCFARPAPVILAAGLALLAGCATGPSAERSVAADRGRIAAERACGGCHGMGLTGTSPWRNAPAFRDMDFDYRAMSYERRVAELTGRHVNMPIMELSRQDLREIAAYVRSLKRAEAGERRR